jgi:bifunctional N-acetylglucosamine-1-phosphate-uridyltransferase/glucosamine-1-phosphate-acetyltransferase GlmU-like protein
VLSGDVPLLEVAPPRAARERRLDEAAIALVSVDAVEPGDLGRVVRDEAGIVDRIVERKDATDDELAVSRGQRRASTRSTPPWLRARHRLAASRRRRAASST